MSKRRSSSKRSRQPDRARGAGSDSRDPKGREASAEPRHAQKGFFSPGALRETIESIAVAFVLAFLFRTFEAEAFVIPTGSMAPTLMGRHKDLQCPQCGYWYQVSASEEVNAETNVLNGQWVEGCTCPMCRYPLKLGQAQPTAENYPSFWDKYPSFKGDRILVGKLCYQFGEPDRWDVAVFKYPGGAKTNFIKRLVGLPGETIQIKHGDVFVKQDEQDFSIARKKSPEKLLAMLQPVYDNQYVVPAILELGWPARWQPQLPADGDPEDGWTTSSDYRSFQTGGQADGETWVRYRHVVPSADEWREYLEKGRMPPGGPPPPQLISDFCAYNTNQAVADTGPDRDSAGLHWVGDLAVECTLEVLSDSGQAVLELIEGGWRMQCRIDLSTGKATLAAEHEDPGRVARTIDGKDFHPTAQTAVRGSGQYEVIFANCDDQLRLWVDGEEVRFDTTACYAPLDNWMPSRSSFASDLSPVGIGSQGAGLEVSELKVLRDIYYIAEKPDRSSNQSNHRELTDFELIEFPHRVLSNPKLWGAFEHMKQVEFELDDDQFLALGDNSAKSKDSRLWARDGFEYYVRRELLIGKALYIYWPHSWDKVPGTDIPCPMFPNFAQMGFVR